MYCEPARWNVIFLVNALPPQKLVVLQRAANKKFAPNLYTGIGGKVEPGEDILASAYRELVEETGIDSAQTVLTEFACANIDGLYSLHYFWGIYPHLNLPKSEDGTLYWVQFSQLLDLPLIPTTWAVCKVWSEREYVLDEYFAVNLHETGQENGVRLVEATSISPPGNDQ